MIQMIGMRLIATSLLILPLLADAGQAVETSPTHREANVVQAIGLVRYFHPHETTEVVDWNDVIMKGFDLADADTSDAEFSIGLANLLKGFGNGIERIESDTEAGHPGVVKCGSDDPEVRWVHLGFDASPVDQSRVAFDVFTSRRSVSGIVDEDAASEDAPDYAEIELVDGSTLQIPMVLCQTQTELTDARREELESRSTPDPIDTMSPPSLARLDVAVLWPVVRNFYPYQELVEDWTGILHHALDGSRSVSDRQDHRRLLQTMLVPLEDGHVNVIDLNADERGSLPVALQPVAEELVVANVRDDLKAKPGDLVLSIDGEPADEWIDRKRGYYSGSPQWRTRWAGIELLVGPRAATRTLVLNRGGEAVGVNLRHEADDLLKSRSHASLEEVTDGIIYVDLTTIESSEIDRIIPRLDEARGAVFDMRGSPKAPVHELVRHLMDGPDDWMGWTQVLLARGPDGDLVVAKRSEWEMEAATPRISAPVVFLADENAISYMESILGLVKYHGMATIVGSNTAGSNGNIVPLALPGEFRVNYTGMRVIGPDGEPYQGRGIEPDIRVYPTIEGLRAGRDELLERALELLD